MKRQKSIHLNTRIDIYTTEMTRKEIPRPRLFKLTHPRLKKIRTNFRKVIQLAVSEEWHRLMDEKAKIRAEGMPMRKRKRYRIMNQKAQYLEACYLNSIISPGGGAIGGLKTDVSGDRVRVFNVKRHGKDFIYDPTYVVKKHFPSLDHYFRLRKFHMGNWERFAPLCREHPEKVVSFEQYHYKAFPDAIIKREKR